MRFGLVKFLNAYPLDYGIRMGNQYQWIEDTPSRLASMLLAGELDAALISTAECLRNNQILDYYDGLGVCARNRVDSILYITPAPEGKGGPETVPSTIPSRILMDQGSRSSSALLQILFKEEFNISPPYHEEDPYEIPLKLNSGEGGLLIGDRALSFHTENIRHKFNYVDLAAWWNRRENLPFIFALWAYPKSHPIDHSVFENSYKYGKSHLEQIISDSSFITAREYLTERLHYEIGKPEKKAILTYGNYLQSIF